MDKAYSTLIMKITNREAISDAVATVNFVLPGIPVKNLQSEIKSITVNIPDGSKLRSMKTCNLYLEFIPETKNLAHIVPGLAHISLISTSGLWYTGC